MLLGRGVDFMGVLYLLPHLIQRLLRYIPEPRQQGVRYYGLYNPKKEEIRAKCREHLGQGPEEEPEFLDCQSYLERFGEPEKTYCPKNGAPLIASDIVVRKQGRPRPKLRPGCRPLALPPPLQMPLPLPKAA
jgi:hypothetical protein